MTENNSVPTNKKNAGKNNTRKNKANAVNKANGANNKPANDKPANNKPSNKPTEETQKGGKKSNKTRRQRRAN